MAHLSKAIKALMPKSIQSLLGQQDDDNALTIPDIPPELQKNLQNIVDEVVTSLGHFGAVVATLENGYILPIRAYAVNIPQKDIEMWEERLGMTFIGPKAVTYLNDKTYEKNLSIRAVTGRDGQPEDYIVSDQLFDLFRPIVNRTLSRGIQTFTRIKTVIAMPFFIEDEVVGNLFVATRNEAFSPEDINALLAFGKQAAAAIQIQRRLTETEALERVILTLQASITDEVQVLQFIVDTAVKQLGYFAAMMATLEEGNALPVQAYRFNLPDDILRLWEEEFGVAVISDKSIVYLDDDAYKDNLAVRAVKGTNGHPEKYLMSDQLYDLFRPIIAKPLAIAAQKFANINQTISVPFSLEGEVVGNLFVASHRTSFSDREIELLIRFGQQAAAGLRNARLYRQTQDLYRQSEERREIAQIFAKMAFFANTAVHDLSNALGLINSNMYLIDPPLDFDQEPVQHMMAGLEETRALIHTLNDPFRDIPDEPVDIHAALMRAARKAVKSGVINVDACQPNLPKIISSYPMISEIFRIFFKNGLEAMQEVGVSDGLVVSSFYQTDTGMIVVDIQDSGVGIEAEDLPYIFQFKWTTKRAKGGLGFGLFWAKDTIENLGGRIEVRSKVGKGTTFRLLLPAEE
ncbi:MAG: ATP-binding protein [Chloroflexota bacterium]